MYRSYVDRHENDVINNALLRAVRNGNPRNPLRGPICIFNTVDRTSYLVLNNSLFRQEYKTANWVFAHDEKYRTALTCNSVSHTL